MNWQPIETAPKDGTWILAICAGIYKLTGEPYLPSVVHWRKERWRDESTPYEFYEPTHWMPLPDPPNL